jgi:hypothetical protein
LLLYTELLERFERVVLRVHGVQVARKTRRNCEPDSSGYTRRYF